MCRNRPRNRPVWKGHNINRKWYINKMRNEGNELFFLTFISILHDKQEAMIFNNRIQDRDDLEWQNTLYGVL